jgi:hypothetical protein
VRKQIDNGDILDILEVECGLRTAALADASRVLCELLFEMASPGAYCPVCGNAMQSQGKRSKKVVSLLGEGRIARDYLHCPSCGTRTLPKDGLLHIEDTSFTPGIRRVAAKLAACDAFESSSEDMELLCGVSVSAKEVERISERIGEGIEKANKQGIEAAFDADKAPVHDIPSTDAPIKRAYIEFDGTGVPMTRRELKGRKGKQDDGTAKTREAKLGCIFTQSGVDDKRNPVRDKNSTTYFGAIECAEDFGRRLYAAAVLRGVKSALQLVIIGDGARWIWNLADLHFPSAIQIVDIFHAKEHVWSLIKASTSDDKVRKRYKKQCYTLLEKGAISKLIEKFRSLPSTEEGFADLLDREIGYFTDNTQRMQYAKFKKMGMFCGSGVIEAGCKNVIGKRLKQSGMHWSVRGANAIIALRCSILSRTFDADFESLLVA